jgi:hypothetical protein
MKKLLYISFLALIAVFFIQCDSEDDLMTENALEGGLIDISATSMNYVVGGTGTYTFDLYVHQEGSAKINTVNIYKSFYNVTDGELSPEMLELTINITETSVSHSVSTFDWAFADLREGLEAYVPAADGSLTIGDYFNFVVESVLSDGRVVRQATPIKMTVSTRYAGAYKCIDALYYRIGVLTYTTADWPAVTNIESVDAITYRIVEYFGAFDGNTWYMQIDPVTLVITYPEEWDGVAQEGNGNPLITCESNPADMVGVNCGSSNYVVNDDVDGKDLLYMTFGYFTAGSGPRTFYQVLEKIPN